MYTSLKYNTMGRPKIPRIIKKCEECGIEFSCLNRLVNIRRFCSKKCANNNPEIKAKNAEGVIKTCIAKYGVRSPSLIPSIKEKQKQTMKDRYGVEHALQSTNFLNKVKQTNLDRYGVDNTSKLPEMISKRKSSWKKNSASILEKRKQKFFKIKWQQICSWNHLNRHFTELEFRENIFINPLKFSCIHCNKMISSILRSGYIPSCSCTIPKKFRSKIEDEIIDFLKNDLNIENIKCNDRSVLKGTEIDIFLPDYKLAIEVNGLYWHSENFGGKGRNYHLNKTKMCSCNGIQLIHIFDYEWYQKNEIIKSILRSKTNKTDNFIYARKCSILEIDNNTLKEFLNKNHLQGHATSKINIGLYDATNMLVGVLTFKKPRFSNNEEYELIRYANLLNTGIIGGFEKMLHYFIRKYNPKSIITYSDRRIFSGNVYLKSGFSFIGMSDPAYHYFKQHNVYNRMQFQKHKLKNILPIFDPNISEYQNMINNGYDRFWDCGNLKFKYTPLN